MDAPSVERFKREISILITWLNKNIPTYFSVEYVNPPQQYIDQVCRPNPLCNLIIHC